MEENFIQFHMVGCMVFYGQMYPMVYFMVPNIQNYANLTIAIIQHLITHWFGNLPQFLYVQMDNTNSKNKNEILFGYMSMLVELENFQKLKFGLLVVGHTHYHIDQMFRQFVVRLKRKNVRSLPSLIQTIKRAYLP